jgi:asparagine synthase (glutamine-hydrolysing)
MCGIFGLIQVNPFHTGELHAMSRLIRHRGPDDEGFAIFDETGMPSLWGGADTPNISLNAGKVPWSPSSRLEQRGQTQHGGLALGHRRLSIIDLSPHGHQPMSDESGRFWITYNGEIYNYLELRDELRVAGYCFRSDSDTEVILAAYRHWGAECLSRFNGMWAFGIFDREAKSIFLARDRFGVKPLYVWQKGERMAFASEIKAFTELEGWNAKANRERLLDFLVWNILDHSEETMFDGVRQLMPGHCVTLDLRGVFVGTSLPVWHPKRWYSLPEAPAVISGPAAVEGLRELLSDSVRLRMRADVPLGSCLSGGLDSSAIVCLMAEQLGPVSQRPAEFHTFTARSHDAQYDEFEFAQTVIKRAGSTAHTVIPEPHGLFEDIDRLAWHQDEPFVSTSIFAQWCVFRLARSNGVTVMLDGQGADETLGGYRGFFGAHLASLLRNGKPLDWWREIRALNREIGFSTMRSAGYTAAYLAPKLVGMLGRFDGRSYADRGWLDPAAKAAYTADPLGAAGGRPCSVREMSMAQVTATNLPMLLHWEDRNSMAHSIEARVPFLDYRVVEHCLAMADEEKVGQGVTKRALRTAMRGSVPDIVIDRRDKMGFVTAETLWASRDVPVQFRAALEDAVLRLPGLLSPSLVKHFDDMLAGRRSFDHIFWRAISTSCWVHAFNVEVP